MHLLQAQAGTILDGSEAVDLAQSPADVIVLSAADTELAALAAARASLGEAAPGLRLANLMQLAHNLSVDIYADRTVRGSRLVVVRLLGGAGYWPYGLEQLFRVCTAERAEIAVLPGDDQPDPDLDHYSTLSAEHRHALWQYLVHGGPENSRNFLAYAGHLLGLNDRPAAPAELLRAGLYWPGESAPDLETVRAHWLQGAPVAAVTFYRALVQGGSLAPVDALIDGLAAQGLNPLPVFVSSLKDPVSAATLDALFRRAPPAVVLNATGFAVAAPGAIRAPSPLDAPGSPVLQVIFSGSAEAAWEAQSNGLSARDLAMNVALPEVDGRVLARAVSFKSDARVDEATQTRVVTYRPRPDRIAFVAALAANWARLRTTPVGERNVAVILANYPNRDGRVGNGVGLDTPAGTVALVEAMIDAGYDVPGFPATSAELIETMLAGPTNADIAGRTVRETLSVADYDAFFATLPAAVRDKVTGRWGAASADPFFMAGEAAFALPVMRFGRLAVAIQPARGYNIDPKASYHDPDLVPPHGYLAFYAWLRTRFAAHAVIHMGKHGNLEWLPGKAVALSESCFPEAALGPLPNIYPFIVNDPGEGTQAKRRSSAVIVDHLTPPLTRAESYGPLKDLEALVDEYYEAAGVDPRRLKLLREQILELTRSIGLDQDCGIAMDESDDTALAKLDNYLCELKEMQIRDGLHVFGRSPDGARAVDLLVALARVPRNRGEGGDASLIRALARDLGLDGFDPLDCAMGTAWAGPRPDALATVAADPWRTAGDTVERLELLAVELVAGRRAPDPAWQRTGAVLDEVDTVMRPAVAACGAAEITGTLTGLDGRFVEPGPSGAPTRGRTDVLPTGRNFYSVDTRTVPTPAAWLLGWNSAGLLVARHRQDHGEWPRHMGLSAWGTSNMRTGGDDVAQALALIGARPTWDNASRRVTGFEIMPLSVMDRPRVDVTLRVSGFFRDAFPAQIDLFDSAVRAVGALDEPAGQNPIAARMAEDRAALIAEGLDDDAAGLKAGFRVFGSKPGAYGAGLQALIDEKGWDSAADLARAYLAWGGYAYGSGAAGAAEPALFARRLAGVEAVVHNQDNREHDLLDSDDYYQFEGGMTAAVAHLSGTRPTVYHNDHSRPERPVVRTLEEEIGRVVRARVVNPKWIAGVMRHGYKGAFEIAATVDYLFAFSATTGAVRDHHFEAVYEAFVADEVVRDFMADSNPDALREMAARLAEAVGRGLWKPKSNSAAYDLDRIAGRVMMPAGGTRP